MIRAYAEKIGGTVILFLVLYFGGLVMFGPVNGWERGLLWLVLWVMPPSVTDIKLRIDLDKLGKK